MRRTKKDLDMESMFQKIMPSATGGKADGATVPGQIPTMEPVKATGDAAVTPGAPQEDALAAADDSSVATSETGVAPVVAPVKTAHIVKAAPGLTELSDEAPPVPLPPATPMASAIDGTTAGAAGANTVPGEAAPAESVPVASANAGAPAVVAAPSASPQAPIPVTVDAVVTHTAEPAPSPLGTVPLAVAATVTVAAAVAATSTPVAPASEAASPSVPPEPDSEQPAPEAAPEAASVGTPDEQPGFAAHDSDVPASSDATAALSSANSTESDLPAPVLVNLARPFLESRLDAALAKFQCCTCENCQLDVLAVALNKVHPQYVLLPEGVDPLTQVSAILAREAVTALVQSILLIKVHPRH